MGPSVQIELKGATVKRNKPPSPKLFIRVGLANGTAYVFEFDNDSERETVYNFMTRAVTPTSTSTLLPTSTLSSASATTTKTHQLPPRETPASFGSTVNASVLSCREVCQPSRKKSTQ